MGGCAVRGVRLGEFGRKRPGDVVNLETDVIGKYVEKLLLPRPETETDPPTGGITLDFLARNGF